MVKESGPFLHIRGSTLDLTGAPTPVSNSDVSVESTTRTAQNLSPRCLYPPRVFLFILSHSCHRLDVLSKSHYVPLPECPHYIFYCQRLTRNAVAMKQQTKSSMGRDERGTNNAWLPIGSIESGREKVDTNNDGIV